MPPPGGRTRPWRWSSKPSISLHFLAREQGRAAWDLILAHAFLDLVDLETTLPALLALLPPGPLLFHPKLRRFHYFYAPDRSRPGPADRNPVSPNHGPAPRRRPPSGSSRTGRRLLGHLQPPGPRCWPRAAPTGWSFPARPAIPAMKPTFSISSSTPSTRPWRAIRNCPGPISSLGGERHAQIQRRDWSTSPASSISFGQVLLLRFG